MSDGNGTGLETPATAETTQEKPEAQAPASPLEAKIKAEQAAIQKTMLERQKAQAFLEQLDTSIQVRKGRLNAFEELLKEEQAGAASGPGKVIPGRKGRRAGIA